jgi:chromosomal replication initiator protein
MKKRQVNNSLMRKFHQKFQNVDVLLMDDIQFIESKMKTMEDFFSTFEALYTNNKQIVIASDRLPGDIPKLDNRLRTRFEMGLVVDIAPPDYNTRFEIVKSYANELEVEAEDDVFEYVAQNFVNNVRELKGAFNKVSAYAEFSGQGVTLELAQKALNCGAKKKELTAEKIAQSVADYFETTVKDLKSTARQQKISHARHLAVYLCREVLNMSYEAIGDYFCKKHTTIMYSCDTISEKIKTDKAIQTEIEDLKSIFKG